MDGKTAGVRVDDVHFDAAGRPQRTIVQVKTEAIFSDKKGELKALIQRLAGFAQGYANLSDSQRKAAMRDLRVQSGEADSPGTVRLAATNVVVSGDVMAIWADASTLLFRRV